jgi:hypothetical protein
MPAEIIRLDQGPHGNPSVQTFTSQKLDWLKCCCFDRRLLPHDFRVAYAIAQHINSRTGKTILSAETIAEESGAGSTRSVQRSRDRLRDAGWLVWTRTTSANIYRLKYDQVDQMLDLLIATRDARRACRMRRGQV